MNEKYEAGMKNAPMEIFVARRKDRLLAISNGLARAGTGNDYNQPVKLHAAYSRFPLSVMNNSKYATANIRVMDLPYIIRKTNIAADKDFVKEGGTSAAYTQVLMVGRCKGKTPAQILEKGDAKLLNETYVWLKENYDPSSRYAAGNKAQMDAIMDASRLMKEGKLQGGSGALTIFESGFRPLVNRKPKDEKSFVYDYMITWNFGNDNPVCVTVSNYYAQVIKKEDGRLNVLPSTAQDKYTNTFRLTAQEWLWAVHMMETTLSSFEAEYAAQAAKICSERFAKNLEGAV